MAFQIKNFVSIAAAMINHMKAVTKKITDFNVGSVARTLVEAPAVEIDELYQQMFAGLMEAIPVATYRSFNFERLAAVSASGLLTVEIAQAAVDVVIPAGTVFTFEGGATGYASAVDVTITPGNTTASVLVAAVIPGAIGNIPANTEFTAAPLPEGYVGAKNAAAFANGTDEETDEQRAKRFADFIATLQRGTVAALRFGLSTAALFDVNGLETERVRASSVIEPWITNPLQPIGLVLCYIHNGSGATSGALVTEAQKVIDGYTEPDGTKVAGWKSAGVKVIVAAATEVSVNFAGVITAAPGFASASLIPLVSAAVNNYIQALDIGASFLLSEAVSRAKAIQGVADIAPKPLGFLAPPAAGGALGATTYYVRITYVNPNGETLASAEVSLAVAANNVLTVASPPAAADAIGWNVYVSTATGTETKQNAASIAIGTPFTEPTTGLIAGSALPTVSRAQLTQVTCTASQKLMPGATTITATN
jgi:hypothetical protein